MAYDSPNFGILKQREQTDPMETMGQYMRLSDLAQQGKASRDKLAREQGVRDAYAQSRGADGQLDRKRFLSQLADPETAMAYQKDFAQLDGAQAEAQERAQKAHLQKAYVFGSELDSLGSIPEQQRAIEYPKLIQRLKGAGVIGPEIPDQYDPIVFKGNLSKYYQHKDYLANALTKSQIRENDAQARAAGVKDSDRAEIATEKAVERMSGKLGNSQDAARTLQEVEAQIGFNLDDYDAKSNQVAGKGVDLPGVSVPLLGRVSAYSGEARTLADTAQKLFNLDLVDRSGAAVSSSELDRLKREYSQGRFNTESELLNAMQRYKRGLQAKMQDIEAANPRAAAQYAEQGGTTSRALAKRTAQAPGGSGASGGWGPDEAHASEPPKGGYRKAGAPVSRDEVAQYAMRHGMKESDAREYLKGQGYAVD